MPRPSRGDEARRSSRNGITRPARGRSKPASGHRDQRSIETPANADAGEVPAIGRENVNDAPALGDSGNDAVHETELEVRKARKTIFPGARER